MVVLLDDAPPSYVATTEVIGCAAEMSIAFRRAPKGTKPAVLLPVAV
jgi:hypothetical protein